MKRGAHILSILIFFACSIYVSSTLAFVNSSFNNSDKENESSTAETSAIDIFLVTDINSENSEIEEYKGDITSFVDRMKKKAERNGDKEYVLRDLFYKVHNKFLKKYSNYVDFSDIFDSGEYDCVTGTALYAILLEELGYSYKIHEFDYHVLLTVDLNGKQIMFESTDFYNGFVADESEIEERLAIYRESKNDKEGDHYIFKANNNRHIGLKELAGLLYFNLAVKQYNLQNFDHALNYLSKAEKLYSSERMIEFRAIIGDILKNQSYFSLKK